MSAFHLGHAGAVALGGAAGALARYALNVGFVRAGWGGLPVATLVANVLGCLLAGLILVWIETRVDAAFWRNLLVVGFLGALTTFSVLGIELWQLLRAERWLWAALMLASHTVLGVAAVALGWRIGRAWWT